MVKDVTLPTPRQGLRGASQGPAGGLLHPQARGPHTLLWHAGQAPGREDRGCSQQGAQWPPIRPWSHPQGQPPGGWGAPASETMLGKGKEAPPWPLGTPGSKHGGRGFSHCGAIPEIPGD